MKVVNEIYSALAKMRLYYHQQMIWSLGLITWMTVQVSHIITEHSLAECAMEEICDNGLDDDTDGLVDLNDPDCRCEVIEPTSLIPNPSFEDMACCPSNRSQMNCAEGWIQASDPTTDYIHSCDWFGWDQFPPPQPFPDGEGIMGFRDGRVISDNPEVNWKEYAGACLINPLRAGVTYRFEFNLGFVEITSSPPIDITFFGTEDCQYLPFGQGNADMGCPTNGSNWVRLGSVRGNAIASGSWLKLSIEVTPSQDIYAIAIGPPCQATQASNSTYYFFDNLVLADLRSFELQISETAHPCAQDFRLFIPEEDGTLYQWYLEGVALTGETSSTISRLYGDGKYEVRLIKDEFCKVTLPYFYAYPEITTNSLIVICADESFEFGDQGLFQSGFYVDTFADQNGCDSVVYLELIVLEEQHDTVQVNIFEGTNYTIGSTHISKEGLQPVNLISSQGCDSLVIVDLRFYHVYIPNIFSPNGDGHNDFFTIYGDGDLLSISRLAVFDRWGTLIHEDQGGSGEQSLWNGTQYGMPVDNGVYVFSADLVMQDGTEHQIRGSVTVIR